MRKPGAHFKFNDESTTLIIIIAIITLFVIFIKPIYRFFGKVQDGTLFEKQKNSSVIETNNKLEEQYIILVPEGASRIQCKKVVSDEGGDKTINLTLYHTNGKLQSIEAKYNYSGMTNEYSNYIFLAQNQFKEKKTANLKNKGYSVEFDLAGNNFKASEVYLLNKTSVEKTGSYSEISEVIGKLDEDVNGLLNQYISNDFKCEGDLR